MAPSKSYGELAMNRQDSEVHRMHALAQSSSPELSDDEELDELDPLKMGDEGEQRDVDERREQRRAVSKAYEVPDTNPDFSQPRRSLMSRICFCGRLGWRKMIVGTLSFVGAVTLLVAIVAWVIWRIDAPYGQSPPWYPTPKGGYSSDWEQAYSKASMAVTRMSLLEKVNITTGTGWQMGLCVGNTGPALSTGIPSLCFQDGPLGIRFADNITAFPAGITVGATWNRDLMQARGAALGAEARIKGVNVQLGPAMGPLGRMPAGGRNWEGFGSDPYLQGVAAALTIQGIQSEGVIATAKHFIGNEQEHFRRPLEWGLPHAVSSNIDDRTMHELYLWPFAESVKAGVGSIMCSYQMVNNSYACQNSKLLNGLLKDELGFEGFVQSDWLAQRSGVASAIAGLDVSMPGDGLMWADGNSLWGQTLTQAVLNTSIPVNRLNDMVTRVLAAWYKMGQDDVSKFPRQAVGDGSPNFSSWTKSTLGLLHQGSGQGSNVVVNEHLDAQMVNNVSHATIVRQIATEAITLLKNDNSALPLPLSGTGKDASTYRIAIFGDNAGPGMGPNACEDRACNSGALGSGWGSGAVDFPFLINPIDAITALVNASTTEISIVGTDGAISPKGSTFLESQDACLVFISADAGEGYLSWNGVRGDRPDLFPQKGGSALVVSVAKYCANTIVVVHSVGPVVVEEFIDMPNVKALIYAHLPGEENGPAIADVLFGVANPSGKLPYTVGKALADYGKGGQVLYRPNGIVPQQNFEEGLYIDYRHFDRYNVTPRYHFGYGLSYTTFDISNVTVETLTPKSAWPDPRPAGNTPPQYDETLPAVQDQLLPSGFRKLYKYVYPYLSTASEVRQAPYLYPVGYDTVQEPSQAGGAPGGNPSLYTSHVRIVLTVTNTGPVSGAEVVQLYLSYPPPSTNPIYPFNSTSSTSPTDEKPKPEPIDFPKRVLREFAKVQLNPGESRTIAMELRRKDLSFWDVTAQNWRMLDDEKGEGKYMIWIGTSSDEKDLKMSVEW